MTITVDIGADLESRLLQEAAKQGVDPGQYIVNAMRAALQMQTPDATPMNAEESRLVEEINRGLSQEQWNRYYELVSKRRAEAMTGQEIRELTALSNRIEELNARRIECLAELALSRGTTLPELLKQLGIASPPVI